MNIVLCAINSKYIHSALAPWYLSAKINNSTNVECDILEFTINESCESILEKILSKNFDLIGFSTYIWNVELILNLASEIKKLTKKYKRL